MKVENRLKIEKRIIRKFISDALAAGYEVGVDNGGGLAEYPLCADRKLAEAVNEAMASDEARVYVRKGDLRGWVYFILGNDGWDVINDYSVNIEELAKGANDLAEKTEGQYA